MSLSRRFWILHFVSAVEWGLFWRQQFSISVPFSLPSSSLFHFCFSVWVYVMLFPLFLVIVMRCALVKHWRFWHLHSDSWNFFKSSTSKSRTFSQNVLCGQWLSVSKGKDYFRWFIPSAKLSSWDGRVLITIRGAPLSTRRVVSPTWVVPRNLSNEMHWIWMQFFVSLLGCQMFLLSFSMTACFFFQKIPR